MANKTLLTQEGYDQLTAELLELKTKKDHLITSIEEVAQPDENGEDGLATQLKEELEIILAKIDKIEEALEGSQIISGAQTKDVIDIGAKVKITFAGDTHKEFHIVSELEANPQENKISDQSPLGKALIGRKADEVIEFEAPVGKVAYRIVSINYA